MYKKVITYTDYNDVERTETHWFNLSESELAEMEYGVTGGMTQMLQNIVDAKDAPSLMKTFKEIIFRSYGIKAPDGIHFIKSDEISRNFSQTEAYSKFFMELITNDNAAAEFINGIIPNKVSEKK